MNLESDDPRLTAFVLGELSEAEAAEVAQAAAADSGISEELRETEHFRDFLSERLALPNAALTQNQREALMEIARHRDRAESRISFRKAADALKPWLIPFAAAAVLAISTLILTRMPDPAPPTAPAAQAATPSAPPEVAAATPPPAPVPPPVAAPFVPSGSMTAADTPTLALPIITEHDNLAEVSNTILNEGSLPLPQSVRIEEILNSFPLRLTGVTAISRSAADSWHPDTRDAGMTRHVATLSTEMLACPWKPSASLLVISLRGNAQRDCKVSLTFRPNAQNVFRFRLLGFTGAPARTAGDFPSLLAANSTASYAIEIEPTRPGAELGTLEWATDGDAAPPVTLIHNRDTEPSDDARFAALASTFAQWLAGEQKSLIDAEILAALARETASATLPPDRAEFLSLIDKALRF